MDVWVDQSSGRIFSPCVYVKQESEFRHIYFPSVWASRN